MAAPNNPMARAYPSTRPSSKHTFPIAGILCNVYGLEQLPADVANVSCLWLLHPRLSKKEHMEPVAHAMISAWNDKLANMKSHRQGLIAVAFDQRNHGTRLADKQANQAWAQGNPRHAQDMYSVFRGTAVDTSLLIDHLAAYTFPRNEKRFTSHFVLGVSLGAHAAWHCVLHDERVSTAVIVVGCADYKRLMQQRAEASKLETWTNSSPQGSAFIGSSNYPPSLIEAVEKFDPAGLLMDEMTETSSDVQREPSDREKKRLTPIMRDHLAGKRILNQAGADDNLVPYACSKPFLEWVGKATGSGGWFSGQGVQITDKVYQDVGHAFSQEMAKDATTFVTDLLELSGKDSKI